MEWFDPAWEYTSYNRALQQVKDTKTELSNRWLPKRGFSFKKMF
jgi:hypothetical protein